MSELVKCATCKTEKPFSEMQTCMRAEREHSVCDMNCMIKFYKGEIKPDAVVTPDLEEMVKLGMNPKEYHLHKENLELRTQLAKADERAAKLERENTNGNAAAELLIWWAQKLSNAPNEDLKEVIRIGYKRIVNLANLIGEEQLRKEQANG